METEIIRQLLSNMEQALRRRGCPHACGAPCPYTRMLDELFVPELWRRLTEARDG